MNPRENLLHSGTGSGTFQASPLSAFHFFRSYNYLLPNDVTDLTPRSLLSAAHLLSESAIQSTEPEKISSILHSESDRPFISKPYNYWQPGNTASSEFARTSTNLVSPVGSIFGNNYKRQRGEKKPIPDEQKDDKYFERRRRNNQAAKKSRDARKLREDQVALKAAILEHENAILRAQILTLRDEATTLRRLLMDKRFPNCN